MTQPSTQPLRIAIVNDYELVVAGLAAVLAPYADRVVVVELDVRTPVVSDVDVILYDTFGQMQGDSVDIEGLLNGGQAKVAVFSWNTQSDIVQRSLDNGASGYLAKTLTTAEMVDALEAVAAGTVVRPESDEPDDSDPAGSWPGREWNLSAREAEVLALITQGLTNQEIADKCYLSINSVKTYIRTAYRKAGVSRRSQAVAWGMEHGFEPDRNRHLR